MKASQAFPSHYMRKDDLPEPPGSILVAVADVRMETMPKSDDEKPVMYFTEKKWSPLILNRGNFDDLAYAYGDDSDGWRGKPVELYVDPQVKFGNEKVGGIRVRISDNDQRTAWTIHQAAEACEAAGISKEELKAAILKSGHERWSAARDTPMVQAMIEAAKGGPRVTHEPLDDSEIPFAWALLLLPCLSLFGV